MANVLLILFLIFLGTTIAVFIRPKQFLKEKTDKETKQVKIGLTIITIIFFALFGIASDKNETQSTPAPKAEAVSNESPAPSETTKPVETKPSETPKSTQYELDASVKFNELSFLITNNEDKNWTNCKLEMNSGIIKGGYTYKAEAIPSKDPLIIPFSEFTKGDGTRFNSYDTKPKNVSISCDRVDGEHGFNYFGLE